MALLLYVNNARALNRERVFRDRTNPLDVLNDRKMHKYYRFTRQGVMRIIDLIQDRIAPLTERSHSIDSRLQVFVALNFYATSDFYSSVQKEHGVSSASVCRIVARVSEALANLKDEVITWRPVVEKQREFMETSGFPMVVGAVDCTHIWLDGSPLGDTEYAFINRKGWHSINVQYISDAKYNIINVSARWPGSVHDSRVFENSAVGQSFQRGELEGVILGDSGYPQRSWLMTPFRNPQTPAERAYNRSHMRGRVVVEQTNGQIKKKFPCLRRGLRVEPKKACTIIVACTVLFRLSKEWKEPYLGRDHEVPQVGADDFDGPVSNEGYAARAQLVARCFT
ncbi:putative nuclease HARBI1 [Lytechinus variegatus]|uniref:putative nuclease HARBI1 n=1 Tax=Lytechinus variegatus TaxID=7654 RepID=UPI001BB1F71F|nr:putative nuclease HARBI1 [Lytechinus variegatus]XP_041464095.1 putative nuclease HARBI1 [Lytechinus variegatus]XP_041475635.1 putative nuclease HARBI1 [Lytechinus variegatus]